VAKVTVDAVVALLVRDVPLSVVVNVGALTMFTVPLVAEPT
jgi:hypothetical protein